MFGFNQDQQQHQLGFSPFALITIQSMQDIVIVKTDRSSFFDTIGDLHVTADNNGFTLKRLDVEVSYKYNVPLNYKADELLIEWLKSYELQNTIQTFGFN